MRRAFAILAFFLAASSIQAYDRDPRDELAARALDQTAATPAECWRGIRQQSPMVLFCGHVDVNDLKPLRKAIDAVVIDPASGARATSRWIWADLREFQRRKYETSEGALEARIYTGRKMVVIGYPVPFGEADVEVVACDDPRILESHAGVPRCDDPEAVDEIPDPILQVPAVIPEPAKAVRMTGQVEIRARILVDGSVADVCLVDSSRPGFDFERAAIAAVSVWKMRPAQKDGEPIECVGSTTVSF